MKNESMIKVNFTSFNLSRVFARIQQLHDRNT